MKYTMFLGDSMGPPSCTDADYLLHSIAAEGELRQKIKKIDLIIHVGGNTHWMLDKCKYIGLGTDHCGACC